MTGIDFETLRGPKAIVAHRQIHGEQGGATVHCVVLAAPNYRDLRLRTG